ncbi:MAG: methyltransferase domain-containing protein [Phycisphaerae bacterium]|nr:methyltransferase domain-containing protein [Phycisphaerae bacterium]
MEDPIGPDLTARQVAVEALIRFERDLADLQQHLHSFLNQTDQRAQATDLTYGVIRNRTLLDRLLHQFGDVNPCRVSPRLMNLLRIGAYEWIYAPQTAEYAIVDEAARLAGIQGGRKQVGFVNAVLRNLGRAIENRCVPRETADPRRCVPQSASTGCLFHQPVLPDPMENPAEFFAMAFSLPLWMIQEWVMEYGNETVQMICLGSNRRPSLFLQPNSLKTTPQSALDRLIQIGFECRLTSDGQIQLLSGYRMDDLPGFQEGWFHVLDPASTRPVGILDPQPGETVLDLCSAPGGKTVLMAQKMNNRGTIYATDADLQRLVKVRENCRRLGIENVKIIEKLSDLPEDLLFDAVLADVPCSNSGVMARRCEVRYRITPQAVANLTQIQYAILEQAAEKIRPAGRIVYSTCSILEEENNRLIRRFLDHHPDFILNQARLQFPRMQSDEDPESDGGFAAFIMRR